jgi:hypothetical protein
VLFQLIYNPIRYKPIRELSTIDVYTLNGHDGLPVRVIVFHQCITLKFKVIKGIAIKVCCSGYIVHNGASSWLAGLNLGLLWPVSSGLGKGGKGHVFIASPLSV